MELRVIHENCSGCSTCRLVCALENYREVNPAKALLRIRGRFPSPGDYRIEFCDQCGECAEACPADAIFFENEVYRIDEDECTGCMICVETCPKNVMMERKDGDSPAKCIACGECARICPREAIVLVEDDKKEAA